MTTKKALVSGGCGFVGRRYVRWLLKQGYSVTAVDDLSTGLHPDQWPTHLRLTDEEHSRFSFIHSDFRRWSLEASSGWDIIVHLAAVVGGRMTIEGDPLAVATDLAIDATFFNWVVRQNPKPSRVLYFSSSAAYPVHLQTAEHHVPLAESMISFDRDLGTPDMTYGWSKLTGEFLAQYAAKTYGLNVVSFRPFSGYGEDQDFTYPFPSVIRRVARGEDPIVVWGSGRQIRDFIYIDDCVEASFAALDHLNPGDALNLGSGVGTSFADLAKAAARILGREARVVNDPSKPEGVFARVGDVSKMMRIYTPSVSLDEGIRRVIDFQRANGHID